MGPLATRRTFCAAIFVERASILSACRIQRMGGCLSRITGAATTACSARSVTLRSSGKACSSVQCATKFPTSGVSSHSLSKCQSATGSAQSASSVPSVAQTHSSVSKTSRTRSILTLMRSSSILLTLSFATSAARMSIVSLTARSATRKQAME